jgi:hypothetical protein
MGARLVTVGVRVDEIAVGVRVRVSATVMMIAAGQRRRHTRREAEQAGDAEEDQHHGHGELHREAEPRRDHHVEEDDHAAHHHDGHGVPDAPQASDQGGAPGAPLPAHDRGYGDHVVGVRRMSHAEEETQQDHGQAGNAGRSLSAPSWGLVSHEMSRPIFEAGRRVDRCVESAAGVYHRGGLTPG